MRIPSSAAVADGSGLADGHGWQRHGWQRRGRWRELGATGHHQPALFGARRARRHIVGTFGVIMNISSLVS